MIKSISVFEMIANKVYKELELFLYERIILGFQCKSYVTLGDA